MWFDPIYMYIFFLYTLYVLVQTRVERARAFDFCILDFPPRSGDFHVGTCISACLCLCAACIGPSGYVSNIYV